MAATTDQPPIIEETCFIIRPDKIPPGETKRAFLHFIYCMLRMKSPFDLIEKESPFTDYEDRGRDE